MPAAKMTFVDSDRVLSRPKKLWLLLNNACIHTSKCIVPIDNRSCTVICLLKNGPDGTA